MLDLQHRQNQSYGMSHRGMRACECKLPIHDSTRPVPTANRSQDTTRELDSRILNVGRATSQLQVVTCLSEFELHHRQGFHSHLSTATCPQPQDRRHRDPPRDQGLVPEARWDVPDAEVSEMDSVNRATSEYEEHLRAERHNV